MHPAHLKIKDFTYLLPDEKIAKFPLAERDASKLLIYKNGEINESEYKNISNYLPPASLMVLNETKVIHARLLFQKETGGKIEIFCLEPNEHYDSIPSAMQQTKEVLWKCMVGGAAKWKQNQTLSLTIPLDEGNTLTVNAYHHLQVDQVYILKLSWKISDNTAQKTHVFSFAEVLQLAGNLPIPPYLNRAAEESDEQRYQTVFAKNEGSVAAPTAALHFTKQLLQKIKEKDIQISFLTLHVGAGTFKPVKSEEMEGHDMHAEWISVSLAFIKELLDYIKNKKSIIAVGTTSSRTLESLYWIGVKMIRKEWNWEEGLHAHPGIEQWYPYDYESEISVENALSEVVKCLTEKKLNQLITNTQIIIAPGYSFRVVNALITNFHQSQSTLLLLVAALIGDDWHEIYNYALHHDFRFLSYGDGCLLWKK